VKYKHNAYIGVGSNVGDRISNCTRALGLISSRKGIDLVKVSRWFETEALDADGPSGADPFLNAAIHISTTMVAEDLMRELLGIEAALGRPYVRQKGEPRTIDLDLLLFDDLSLNLKGLTIPHPELTKRLFVLVPLCDIAPDVVHPSSGLTIRDLELRCRSDGIQAGISEWREADAD